VRSIFEKNGRCNNNNNNNNNNKQTFQGRTINKSRHKGAGGDYNQDDKQSTS